LHRDNQTFDEIAELDVPSRLQKSGLRIIDSLNGLVCLFNSYDIVLWNPSLRKSIILPKSRVLSNYQMRYRHSAGFGFLGTSNNYKILKFSYSYDIAEHQAEIYQLSTGSWRNLKLEDSFGVRVKYGQVHLNGVLHWSACYLGKVNPGFVNFIRSFDLKNEKFGTLMVPSCLRHDDGTAYSNLTTFRESLCLVDETSMGVCKIWIMKEYGVAVSWEKLFSIDKEQPGLTRFVYFRRNGELLFVKSCKSSGKHMLASYECENNRVKNDEILANCLYTRVYTYVESLVLIKGPNDRSQD
jgi:F-box interacting protein